MSRNIAGQSANRSIRGDGNCMRKIKGKITARWSIGERVATRNGFIAEIVSLTKDERVLIRYLSMPPGPGETELPLRMLRPATAHDLFLAGIK